MDEKIILAERPTKVVYLEKNKIYKSFVLGYSKSNILNEALNQSRVEETGLPIPKVLGVTTVNDRWSIVNEYIEGKTLETLMKENPAKVDEYLDKFVDFQMEVHSKKAPLLNKLKDKLQRKIKELTDIDASTKYDLETKLDSMPKHDKVCHGDYNPSNIIVKPNGEWYLIDWSHATQGNAGADAALTYIEFLIQGKEDLAEKYLRLYVNKSNTAVQYIQKWISIIAATQMAKANSKEKELLRGFVEVVEY